MADEWVVTDPTTGGQKGQKRARYDLIPARALNQVAEQYGHGASKYADRNWERGYAWSLSYAAMQRHAWAFWSGEDNDPESGLSHLAAVVFHAFALMTFVETHPEGDDRPDDDGPATRPLGPRPTMPPHPRWAHTPIPTAGLPLEESQVWPAAGQHSTRASTIGLQRTRNEQQPHTDTRPSTTDHVPAASAIRSSQELPLYP